MRPTAAKKLQPWKLITEAFKSFLIARCIFAAAAAAAVAVPAVVVAATHCGLCLLLPAAADDVVAMLHFISAGKLFSISAANQKRVWALASSLLVRQVERGKCVGCG